MGDYLPKIDVGTGQLFLDIGFLIEKKEFDILFSSSFLNFLLLLFDFKF